MCIRDRDGEEWVNPLTQVTYVFSEPKKQWINVNGGIVSVQGKPPATPQTGSLWFDTEDDDLTLYIYTGSEWVSASPPVSLDGIEASVTGIQEYIDTNITPALAGAVGDVRALEIKTDGHDGRLDTLETEAQDYASTTEDNTFTGNNEFTNNLILPELPSENTHATNKFYTDAQDTILHGMVDVIVGRRV